MGLVQRGIIALRLVIGAAVVFVVFARGILPVMSNDPGGPATAGLELLPVAIQLAAGALLLGALAYLIFGIGQERTVNRRRKP